MKWIILALVLVLSFSGIVSADTILLEDNFNDGNADGWLEQLFPDLNGDAYWIVQDGKYAGTYSGAPAIASNGDNNWTNYTYEVDVLTNGFDSVVLFRFIDAYNHYDTSFDGNTLDLNRRVNGVYTHDLATVNIPNPPSLPYKYKIVVSGDNIKIYLSNVLYIDYTDVNSPLPKGKIAIGSWSGTREFDNVKVTSSETLPPYVAALWHLDEGVGNIAHDETANNNDGTINGASWITECFSGNCLNFDGVNDFVTITDSDSLDLTTQGTIEGWVKTQGGGFGGIVGKAIGAGPGQFTYAFQQNTPVYGGRLRIVFSAGGGHCQEVIGNTPITDNLLHHVAVTWNGTIIKIYIDGNLDASASQICSPWITNHPVQIGELAPNWGDAFNGIIDEVRISNVALEPSEFLLFQQEPTCTDGFQNGDEEGIDCGGSCPNMCPLSVEERLEILEQKVENLTEENQQQQQQIENLTQGQEALENQTQEHEERIGILETAVSALENLVNQIQQTLNDFMDLMRNFMDLMRNYLSHLPLNLKKGMICGHMFDNHLTNYSDLGLTCTLNATAGCVCEGENPQFTTINQTE